MRKILPEESRPRPFPPDWAYQWVAPDLVGSSSSHFEPGQIRNYCPVRAPRLATDFYDKLKVGGLLRRCLSLEDGRLLIKQEVLPIWFPNQHPVLWRSVVIDSKQNGNLLVPWIQNLRGQAPVVRWWWLEYDLYASHKSLLLNQ